MKLKQCPHQPPLEVKFKFSEEHPLPFHMGAVPRVSNCLTGSEGRSGGGKSSHHYNLENNTYIYTLKTWYNIKQLLNEAEQDMKNSSDQGGCYPQRPKAEVDNTLRDLKNSPYPTKAEFNNCFIIHSKYLLVLEGVSPFRSLFICSPNTTQPCPQAFAVNGSIICSGLHF